MSLLKEIKGQIRDYYRTYGKLPNSLFVSMSTYDDILDELNNMSLVEKFTVYNEENDRKDTLYGVMIKPVQTIEKGYLVSNTADNTAF